MLLLKTIIWFLSSNINNLKSKTKHAPFERPDQKTTKVNATYYDMKSYQEKNWGK